MNIILKSKLNYVTNEIAKIIAIMLFGFILILAIILLKYKPVYEVIIAGEKLGNVYNKANFNSLIEVKLSTMYELGVENVSLKEEPEALKAFPLFFIPLSIP